MRRDETGSIAPLVPIVLLAFLLMGGLVVDGARALNARSDAYAFAEEAARAGATAINVENPDLQVLPPVAHQRVQAYCSALSVFHQELSVSCDMGKFKITTATDCEGKTEPLIVQMAVKETVKTTLLGIIGTTQFTETGVASARPYEENADKQAC